MHAWRLVCLNEYFGARAADRCDGNGLEAYLLCKVARRRCTTGQERLPQTLQFDPLRRLLRRDRRGHVSELDIGHAGTQRVLDGRRHGNIILISVALAQVAKLLH